MRSSVSQSNHLRMAVTVITFHLLWNLLLPLLPWLASESERSLACTCCFHVKALLYIFFPGTLLHIVSNAEKLKLCTCKPSVSCKHSEDIMYILYYEMREVFFFHHSSCLGSGLWKRRTYIISSRVKDWSMSVLKVNWWNIITFKT